MTILGFDYLGLGHKLWPVDATIKLTPAGYAIGCFDNTFGDVLPNLRRVLSSGKFSTIRSHIWWANNHVIAPLDIIKKRAPLYEKLKRDFPDVRIYLSHSCEHTEKNKSKVQERIDLIKKLAPSVIPVNSIWTGAKVSGVITEVHGDKVRNSEFCSTDGQTANDIDIENWIKNNATAEVAFLWASRFNLRGVVPPPATLPPPKERTDPPTPEYLAAIIRLAYPAGTPSSWSSSTPIKKPLLWKSFAEDYYDQEDPRENKPVLIIPDSVNSVSVIGKGGVILGKLQSFGGYPPNLRRYYSGLPGGIMRTGAQIAALALKKTGSEWVWLKAGSKYYGPINPAFRTGYFR